MIVSLPYPIPSDHRVPLLIIFVSGPTLLLGLTHRKTPCKAPHYSMSLPATRLSRHSDKVKTPSGQAAVSKHSTLASTFGSPGLRSRPGTKSRSAGPLQVVLPPALPVAFHGLSPIVSFLASSSHNFGRPPGASSEGVGQSETLDERPNYRIIHGVKYDAYSRNEVPYSMLYDTVTPENELHSYLLMRKLTEKGSPSFLHIPTSIPIRDALDLGCGDGHWAAHAAQAWGVQGTNIVGVDLSLSVEDMPDRKSVV